MLSRPPWISGRPSRTFEPVRVTTAWDELSPARVTEYVTQLKENKLDEEVDSPAIAVAMFQATSVFGGWRSDLDACASRYFETHVEATLMGVLPIAVGEAGPRRKVAERLVRHLACTRRDTVEAVAKQYGKRVVASVREILAVDRRFDCPNAAPSLPLTWRPETFTRPRLRDGRALPVKAVDRIGHMLAFSTLTRRYAGLDDVRAVCESRSLAELAWDMARAWEVAGADSKDQWMLESLAHLGDDEVIRRTTPALTSPYVVNVLGHVATDAAATELCTIAWRANHDKTLKPAQTPALVAAAFATIAHIRGVTVDQVHDSLMPTIPLAAPSDSAAPVSSRLMLLRAKSVDARVALDYGARTIAVGFDERLDPFVQTAGGTRLRDLPTAGVNDDHAKVARAEAVWRELQEDVAAIADVRMESLERAMVTGRSWTLERFQHAWMDHPVMRHVSRSMVWRSASGTAFRIAEDGSFADVNDVEVKGVTEIAVVHPVEMSDDDRARWSDVLLDYRIVQPIEQISRRVLRASAVSGTRFGLVPTEPTSREEIYERLRAKRFDVHLTASRACARSRGRLEITIICDKQKVECLWLCRSGPGVAGVSLERVHSVDLSEIVHDLGVIPRPTR